MAPRHVTIRLLDPPIHGFLPAGNQLLDEPDSLHHLRDSVHGLEVLRETARTMGLESGGASDLPGAGVFTDTRIVDEALKKREQVPRKVRALQNKEKLTGLLGSPGVQVRRMPRVSSPAA